MWLKISQQPGCGYKIPEDSLSPHDGQPPIAPAIVLELYGDAARNIEYVKRLRCRLVLLDPKKLQPVTGNNLISGDVVAARWLGATDEPAFFIFGDVALKVAGEFKFKIELIEVEPIDGKKREDHVLLSVLTDGFRIVEELHQFPIRGVDFRTPLSSFLAGQGAQFFLPPSMENMMADEINEINAPE